MNSEQHDSKPADVHSKEPSGTNLPTAKAASPVRITAHDKVVKMLGNWTTDRRFEVRATRGLVVLDLLLPRLEPGDVEILLDVDHSTIKLLVPDGVNIDGDDLRRVGRGRIKDWTGTGSPDGRLIRLVGEMRSSEVRIHRGGVAILQLLVNPRSRRDTRQAQREGRLGDHCPTHLTTGGAPANEHV
jgi:hypothetical protein